MRVNPIMVRSHYLTSQNINFGMIEDKKTEVLTRDMMMKELEWYDDIIKQDPNSGYEEALNYVEEKIDYFKASRLFTLKSKKNIENKDVLYVVINQKEVDKHEHKELLDEFIEQRRNLYDPSSKNNSSWCIEDAQEAGLPGKEKEFLEILEDEQDIEDFCNSIQTREQGIRPEPPTLTPTNTTPSDENKDPLADDKSYQAYIRYGV